MARARWSAGFSGISHDLAPIASFLFGEAVHFQRTACNLDSRNSLYLRNVCCRGAVFDTPRRTSEAQRLAVLFLGYGVPIVTAVLVLKYRAEISPTRACLIGVNAAYLANAGLCLPVYGQVPGTLSSKPGWLVMLVIVWPMLLEIVWIFVQASRTTIARKGCAR